MHYLMITFTINPIGIILGKDIEIWDEDQNECCRCGGGSSFIIKINFTSNY